MCHKLEDDDRGSHIGLYAKNLDGVLELNSLISTSTSKGIKEDKTDRHFYYNPRISLYELMSTSDNIIFTSACLASPICKWLLNEEKKDARFELLDWMGLNKHRCFLEVQYHNCVSQKQYNIELYHLSKKYNIPLIAGTDTHSSSIYKADCRKILQKAKDSFYGEEDEFDLVWKTYHELVECFKIQNCLPENIYLEAIENTNVMADMVDDFTLDKSFKYPTLYGDNAKNIWKDFIFKMFNYKVKNNIIDVSKIKEYKKRIYEEFEIMCEQGMESFMMFMGELIEYCNGNSIPYGFCRGSVGGSTIAYITDITDVDPIKWNTVFSRFVNKSRISLADIDCDFAPEDREVVYQYIIDRFTPKKTAYIVAFGTLADRGTIDVLAKGLDYTNLELVMDLKNQYNKLFDDYSKIIQEEVNTEEIDELDSSSIDFDNHKIYSIRIRNTKALRQADKLKLEFEELKNNNKDLFYYFDGLKGTIVQKGTHPSGIIGSPITLYDNLGLYYKDGDENHPVSTCAMKAVDSLNYVKFDILGLKTIGLMKDVYKFIGSKYLKSHEINWNDNNVWGNMKESNVGVFQFEGQYAFSLLKDFSPSSINDMSLVNASLRPSGKSYRDRLMAREFNKNPSDEIDNLLIDNLGFLVFQEDTIKFLTDICGFNGADADTCRRHIGKKDIDALKAMLPQILDGYCKVSPKPREIAEAEAKQFIQIISDSSEYQFGYNHSTGYSMNGYGSTRLRTYYPLEFVTAYLNRAEDKADIVNGIALAKHLNIKVNNILFGKSLSEYTFNREEKSTYKGIASIKFCNNTIATEMFELAKCIKFEHFIDVIHSIKTKTSTNYRQLKILTILGFFNEFGKNKKLYQIIKVYEKLYNRKEISIKDLEKFENTFNIKMGIIYKYCGKQTDKTLMNLNMRGFIKEASNTIEDKSFSIKEQCKYELEYLEYVTYINESLSDSYYIVTDFKVYKDKTKPYIQLYQINSGNLIKTKVTAGIKFSHNPFEKLSVLNATMEDKPKTKMINGVWTKTSELEPVLKDWEVY